MYSEGRNRLNTIKNTFEDFINNAHIEDCDAVKIAFYGGVYSTLMLLQNEAKVSTLISWCEECQDYIETKTLKS